MFAMGLRKPYQTPAQAQAMMAGMGAAVWAIWKASGQRWLLVTASRLPGSEGLATKIRLIEADTMDEAREAMVTQLGIAKRAKAMNDEFMQMLRGHGPSGT